MRVHVLNPDTCNINASIAAADESNSTTAVTKQFAHQNPKKETISAAPFDTDPLDPTSVEASAHIAVSIALVEDVAIHEQPALLRASQNKSQDFVSGSIASLSFSFITFMGIVSYATVLVV